MVRLDNKLTQFVDIQAYGESESRLTLSDYISNSNDLEHIQPVQADENVLIEFGEGGEDIEVLQSLGNLLLLEKSINRSIGRQAYKQKAKSYAQSKFLLTKCQRDADKQKVGIADKITKTVQKIESFDNWNAEAIQQRQKFLTKLACKVWDVRRLNDENGSK